MQTTLRKNITLNSDEYETISKFAKRQGLSFSEFIRQSALKAIRKSDDLDLLNYLIKNTKTVSVNEQKEIDAMNIDFENTEGKELTLDEVLQG